MKIKTINAVLTKKHNDWIESIEDEAVRELARKNTIITGGCIVSMLLKEPVNDFDVYFRDKKTAFEVAKYYVSRSKVAQGAEVLGGGFTRTAGFDASTDPNENIYEHIKNDDDRVRIFIRGGEGYKGHLPEENDMPEGVLSADDAITPNEPEVDETEKAKKYRVEYVSANAITLSNKIQIIIRFTGEPEEIHKNYDFVHCTNYWTSWEGKVVTNPQALEAILARELVYTGSKYPLCSIFRTRKFIQRKWTINAGQYLKMALQLQQLDLSSIYVLEDQLIGVDSAYFITIIQALREKGESEIDQAYIMTIINKVFG